MGKILITSGYMGSGSSAVTDLLSEINGCENGNSAFEYVFLHCPDGLFDLEDKLLLGNNALRSDEAIHRFIDCMRTLYQKKHYWVGDYKKHLTVSFMKYVYSFIEEIGTYTISEDWAHWYYNENPNFKMLLKKQIKKVIDKIFFIRCNIPYPRNNNEVYLAFPTEELFYSAAHRFIYSIFSDLGIDDNNLIFDQLVLPHNLYRLDKYFDAETVVFLIERDPRDVFIANKYFWLKKNQQVIFPMEIESFCKLYRKMRENAKEFTSGKVVRIRFEDLIYRYEATLDNIYQALGIMKDDHVRKGERFDPRISINNTQLFTINEEFAGYGDYIKEHLGEYIYEFPKEAPYPINHVDIF